MCKKTTGCHFLAASFIFSHHHVAVYCDINHNLLMVSSNSTIFISIICRFMAFKRRAIDSVDITLVEIKILTTLLFQKYFHIVYPADSQPYYSPIHVCVIHASDPSSAKYVCLERRYWVAMDRPVSIPIKKIIFIILMEVVS